MPFRRLWQWLRRRRPPRFQWSEDPPEDPALVPVGPPRRPRPSGAVALELPDPYEFDDHAEHPRSDK